ncbi:MAG: hypothetical protein J6T24_07930 [Clostridia bacterium]|nr:hypothetical protein [Clostridia bacterium]
MATLPPYFENMSPLRYDWFPTLAQCFIYRNWEMLSPARLARVLSADEETVCRMAADMGLGESTANEGLWLTRGYVTLIRANWHLLTYPQLCTLLDWEEDHLAFILHEDDFLDVKLGRKKPDVPTLTVTPLDAEAERKTAAICRVTKELYARLPERQAAPFDFFPLYRDAVKAYPPIGGESRFRSATLLSYPALYGDTFYEEDLIEVSFPEDLLLAYAALGIGGLTCQAVLYALVPCRYAPELSVGWERRIRGLNKVIARLKKYGLKLYLYLNEPRELPDHAFLDHPELRGDVTHPGYAVVCLSTEEGQDYLRDAVKRLTELAPGIGGYSVTTASENHTNCYSHRAAGNTTCPRCIHRRPSEIYSTAVRMIYEGAIAADPNVTVTAASWAWDTRSPNGAEIKHETVTFLPPEVAVGAVSEHRKKKKFEDTEVEVHDYSISIPGPSEVTLDFFRAVRAAGKRVSAKIQLGNSWELSNVPYIPVFRHFYTAIRDLCEKVAPDSVGLTWTMGGFPSPVLRLFAEMTRAGEEIPAYEELIARLLPTAEEGALLKALDALDAAFDELPFSIHMMYHGPQHIGPALPLWSEPTGWHSCMVGPVYDDIERASNGYPKALFLRQFDKLADGWERGLALLQAAYEGKPLTPTDRLLLDCAESAYLHFASARNHIRYIMERESGADLSALIREEETLAIREASLVAHNPTLGFEATNHYFYTRTDLFEKVLNCRYLLGDL